MTNAIEAGEVGFVDSLSIRATAAGSTASHDFATVDYSAGTGWVGPWTETNDDGLAGSGSIRIVGGELLLEGSGGNPERIIERQVDLSNAAFAYFSFDWRCVGDTEVGQDFVFIEAFDDNTTTWETLQTKEGDVDMCVGNSDSGSDSDSSLASIGSSTVRKSRHALLPKGGLFFVSL